MRRTHRSRGLSLVEVLITVAICGGLMTAVAVAFNATAQAVEQNERFFRASQTARVCVTQIMAETRKCRSGVVDDSSFEIVTAGGETRTYAYNPELQQVTMTIHTPLPPYPVYVVARDVSAASFTTNGGSVSLNLTVTVKNQSITLGGSTVPRKTIQYR